MVKIEDIQAGQAIDDSFFLAVHSVRKTRNGKDFMTMELRDETGMIRLINFNYDVQRTPEFVKHNGVHVRGVVESFNNSLQIKADVINPIELTDINTEDLIAKSKFDIDEMLLELREIYEAITNPWLKQLMFGLLDDASFVEKFKRSPAAKYHHHPFRGGLLEHILSVTKIGLKVCEHYTEVDRDILLAGIFFHDIGKVDELELGIEINYTDAGKLMGHITIGVEMVHTYAAKIDGFPLELEMVLKHLILSHHGQLAYGSPKLPATLEAVLLHYLDNMDAKVWGFLNAVKKSSEDEHWTAYSKMFETALYKGTDYKKEV